MEVSEKESSHHFASEILLAQVINPIIVPKQCWQADSPRPWMHGHSTLYILVKTFHTVGQGSVALERGKWSIRSSEVKPYNAQIETVLEQKLWVVSRNLLIGKRGRDGNDELRAIIEDIATGEETVFRLFSLVISQIQMHFCFIKTKRSQEC